MLFTRPELQFNSRARRAERAAILSRNLLIAACALFAGLTLLIALTNLPFADEGTFGGSALNILRTGHSGNPSTPPYGLGFPLIESQRYNFWVMPAYLYTLAAWYRFMPETLMSARSLSVIFGVIALALFYQFIRRLSGSRMLGALAVALLACDFNLVMDSSLARMDSMSLALNLGAWVAYLALRRRNLGAALFSAGALAGLSFVTHPNGTIAFCGAILLAFLLDLGRLAPGRVVAFVLGAAIPLFVGASTMLQAPSVFFEQMRAHSQHRFDGFLNPVQCIYDEFLARYFLPFGGRRLHSSFSLAHWALLFVLLLYLVSAVWVLSRFRRSPLLLASGGILLITAVYFTFFETGKLGYYNMHLLPWFALFTAMAALRLARGRPIPAIAGIALIVLINLVWSVYFVRSNQYRSSYQPAMRYLRANMGPRDLALAHAFFGYDLGFNRVTEDYTLVDVVRKHPLFVIEDRWIHVPATTKAYRYAPDPEDVGMISKQERIAGAVAVLTKYHPVLRTPDFVVLKRAD